MPTCLCLVVAYWKHYPVLDPALHSAANEIRRIPRDLLFGERERESEALRDLSQELDEFETGDVKTITMIIPISRYIHCSIKAFPAPAHSQGKREREKTTQKLQEVEDPQTGRKGSSSHEVNRKSQGPSGPSGGHGAHTPGPGRIQEDVGCAFPGLDDEQLRQAQQRDPDLAAVEAALWEEKVTLQ
ncbi:unnamed protein product [Lampetra fluviatilis]